MPFCQYCNAEIGYLPFKCKYCGGVFCKKHRLPENHDCTFELKHTPVVPIPNRGLSRSVSSSSQQSSAKPPRKIRKFLKRQEKQKIKTIRDFENYRDYQSKGSMFLIISILILSLAAFVYPLYLTLSSLSFLDLWWWTFITSLFVSYSQDFFGLFFLFILIILFYVMIKNLERTFGTKFLLTLYLISGFLTGLFYVLLWLALEPFYSGIILVPVGLASGALLGVICFMVFLNLDREMMFLLVIIPVRMKGRTIIAFLVLLRVVPGLLFAIGNPLYLLVYMPPLGGVLASYLVYAFKYKR
ncbi:MAG: rhomboid family intramembrane serine protease [Promethearchaeota archaeon]|nr:MAG: rhomboid family intramembrane serine protease [Candidatus Lokiarchaeota archaeon]